MDPQDHHDWWKGQFPQPFKIFLQNNILKIHVAIFWCRHESKSQLDPIDVYDISLYFLCGISLS